MIQHQTEPTDTILVKVHLEKRGGGAEFAIPYYGEEGVVEIAAKYMLAACGWRDALVDDGLGEEMEGLIKSITEVEK